MMYKIIAVVSLIITLSLVNWSIANKETHLANGKTIYLEIAPRDPRSLMQGDYMVLRFSIENELRRNLPASGKTFDASYITGSIDGNVIVSLDERGIAKYSRIDNGKTLTKDEIKIQFRVRNNMIIFATNAFFFQEGKANVYQAARYGHFKVNGKGELLLTAMHDSDLKELGL